MMDCFPLISDITSSQVQVVINKDSTYKALSNFALKNLQQQLLAHSELKDITLTDDFSNNEIPECSIAYYRIWGPITSSSRWDFSSKQFEQDLLSSELNSQIACHFFHINSPGGEAWYLDRLSETIRSLEKPIVVLIEKCCASAAYYIGCHSNNIFALTQNDSVGCIGTMVDFLDIMPYFEKLGLKHITAYSSYSDLKNKKYNDLENGKPKQFIEEELDPLSVQFITEVRSSRDPLKKIPDKDPILRGETYSAAIAKTNGLIDDIITFPDAVARAYELGQLYKSTLDTKKRALSYV